MSDKTICANCHRSYSDLHTCKCNLRLNESDFEVRAMFRKQQIMGFRFAVMHYAGDSLSDQQIGEILDLQKVDLASAIDDIGNKA